MKNQIGAKIIKYILFAFFWGNVAILVNWRGALEWGAESLFELEDYSFFLGKFILGDSIIFLLLALGVGSLIKSAILFVLLMITNEIREILQTVLERNGLCKENVIHFRRIALYSFMIAALCVVWLICYINMEICVMLVVSILVGFCSLLLAHVFEPLAERIGEREVPLQENGKTGIGQESAEKNGRITFLNCSAFTWKSMVLFCLGSIVILLFSCFCTEDTRLLPLHAEAMIMLAVCMVIGIVCGVIGRKKAFGTKENRTREKPGFAAFMNKPGIRTGVTILLSLLYFSILESVAVFTFLLIELRMAESYIGLINGMAIAILPLILFGPFVIKINEINKKLFTVMLIYNVLYFSGMAFQLATNALTFSRLIGMLYLIAVAFILAGLTATVLLPKFPFFRYVVVVVTCLYLVLAIGRPDYIIATVNVARGELFGEEVDYSYLCDLGADAAPVLIAEMDEAGYDYTCYFSDESVGWLGGYNKETFGYYWMEEMRNVENVQNRNNLSRRYMNRLLRERVGGKDTAP